MTLYLICGQKVNNTSFSSNGGSQALISRSPCQSEPQNQRLLAMIRNSGLTAFPAGAYNRTSDTTPGGKGGIRTFCRRGSIGGLRKAKM